MERTTRILLLVTAAAAFALGCARSHARISEPPDPVDPVEAGMEREHESVRPPTIVSYGMNPLGWHTYAEDPADHHPH